MEKQKADESQTVSNTLRGTAHTKLRIFVLGEKDAKYLHASGINEGTYLARYEKAKLDSSGRVRLTLVLDPTSVEDRVSRRMEETAHEAPTELGSTVTGLHADAVAVTKVEGGTPDDGRS